jgi:hypothetical protein
VRVLDFTGIGDSPVYGINRKGHGDVRRRVRVDRHE